MVARCYDARHHAWTNHASQLSGQNGMNHLKALTGILAALTTSALVVHGGGIANAADVTQSRSLPASVVLGDIGDAVAQSAASPAFGANAHGSVRIGLPESGRDAVRAMSVGLLTMAFPARGRDLAAKDEDIALFAGTAADTAVAVEDLGAGVRALVHIESPDAPERYDFPIGGDVGSLRLTPGGGVEALSAARRVIATAAPPWAIDAQGVDVPTHYEVDGTTLTQVVEHRGHDFAYGIVADPSWWSIAKCVAAITWVLGSTAFAASKITKNRAQSRRWEGSRRPPGCSSARRPRARSCGPLVEPVPLRPPISWGSTPFGTTAEEQS